MLPMDKKDRGAIVQIIFYTCVMILVSVAPVLTISNKLHIHPITAVIVLALGGLMLYYAIILYKTQQNTDARKLMLASIFYITIVPIIYVIDKFLH